jgi:hypothetical protein
MILIYYNIYNIDYKSIIFLEFKINLNLSDVQVCNL